MKRSTTPIRKAQTVSSKSSSPDQTATNARSLTATGQPSGSNLQRKLALVGLAAGATYLIWRLTGTFNEAALGLSVFFFAVEAARYLGLGFYVHATWKRSSTTSTQEKSPELTTTCVIRTADEPADVLLPVLASSSALAGNTHTWVIDQGSRSWVKTMATDLEITYRTGTPTTDAVLGDLSWVLTETKTDLIAVIDGHQIPRPEFLADTIGYFDDDKMAFVQTPFSHDNEDAFERVESFDDRELTNTIVFPAKNTWGAAPWVGPGSVVRRAALLELDESNRSTTTSLLTATERLHGAGWSSWFHHAPTVYGLAPTTYTEYFAHLRSQSAAAANTFWRHNPVTLKGLSWAQKLAHLTTVGAWASSWVALACLLLPLLVVLSGELPFRPSISTLALVSIFWLGGYFGRWFLTQRQGFHPLWSTVFALIKLPTRLTSSITGIWSNKAERPEKPIGRTLRPPPPLLVGVFVIALCVCLWGALRLIGVTEFSYDHPPSALAGLLSTMVVAGLLGLALHRIVLAADSNRRTALRIERQVNGKLKGEACTVESISVRGVRVRVPKAFTVEADATYPLEVFLAEPVALNIRPIRSAPSGETFDTWAFVFAEEQWRARAVLANLLFRNRLELFLSGHVPPETT